MVWINIETMRKSLLLLYFLQKKKQVLFGEMLVKLPSQLLSRIFLVQYYIYTMVMVFQESRGRYHFFPK